MVDVQKLQHALKKNGITIEMAAKALGIDQATMYRRLQRQGAKFTVEEVAKIADLLHLEPMELQAIFFSRKLA